MDIKIGGERYPMTYTVEAQSEIAERFGGLENIELALSDNDTAKLMENIVFCACAMLNGASNRLRAQCRMSGKEIPRLPEITFDDLKKAICVSEIAELTEAVVATMREGNKITVELAEDRKNEEATRSE